MPNFIARIKPVVNTNGLANIKIQVSHQGTSRYLGTTHYIEPDYFDNKKGRVKDGHPNAADINIELTALELTYQRKALKLEGRLKDVSIQDLINFLQDTDNQGALDFFSVAEKRLDFLERIGKYNSAVILKGTIAKVRAYQGSKTLPFMTMSKSWLDGFQSWYCMTGSQNSAAIHLRNIRTLFNVAVDDYGLSQEYYPFRKFKIKTEETIHKDLEPEEIARLMAYPAKNNFQQTAIDLWLLSFFLVGINFKDLLLMEKEHLKKGRLVYNRHKTKTIFSVKVEPEAQALINKYHGKKLLLSFTERQKAVQEKKDRTTPLYKDVLDRTNEELKKIAGLINNQAKAKLLEENPKAEFEEVIEPNLSTYYARHSWASIASRLDIPHDVIREALGHTRSVTDIYIKFYTKRIDEANRKIIDHIIKSDQQV